MLSHSTRRWLAGLGVAGAFVAASATPAFAANPTIAEVVGAEGFSLYANDVIVAPDGPEKWISLYSLVDEPFTDYTVKVDRSAVDGFAEVQKPEGPGSCTEAGAVLTCTVKNDAEPDLDLLSLPVLPRDGAKAGQEGQLQFTVTTPNAGTATFRSTVTIGEGVDLTSEPFVNLTGTPGSTVPAPLSVGNQGKTDAEDAVLFFFGSYALAPAKRYENCEYFEDNFDEYAYACTLDATVAAGGSAKLDDSFGFAVPGDAWAPNTDYGFAIWMTPADWQAFRSQVPDFGKSAKGDEGVLKLTPTAPSRALARAMQQTDVDPTNNETMIQLTVKGNQKADVAANGATLDAEVGATVPVTVGFTNNGPAAINAGGEDGIYTLALVTLPKGTTAVKAPEQCADAEGEFGPDSGKAGAAVYACFVPGVVGSGKKAEFPFSLRVDQPGTLAGKVELFHGGPDETNRKDLNPANDTAKILVKASGDGGQGGGGGGTLPITGSSTGLIAGIGALLLAAGAAGYVVSRRRKTRFVA
ncbi:LPXTG cell wall anchor domain-containing protein [Micromonospora fulviviridis]|uniref:LPXTG cell wall anchor domain-containing protein n=1 Tax=Micromonospora fulviviridis TaxID=47860 RepID=UPI0037A5F5DB